jgi:hypothetical protein
MPYDQKHPLPVWYQNSGARRANRPTDKDGDIWQADFSDPLYLKYWGEVVAAAGARYDWHPDLDSVDISSVGYWGEGWSDYMPAFPYQKALIDIWLQAFKRTPLLMNFDQEQALAYGTQQGAGWRLDCWGDMRDTTGGRWCHMFDLYPEQIVRAGVQDAWQRSPVSLETCWVPGYWKQQGWDVDYILAQALRWHVSSVNIKSSAIPSEWKPKFDDFQKKMGYRFILRRLEYARGARAGTMTPLHMWWLNAGVAPVYRPYELALQADREFANRMRARAWLSYWLKQALKVHRVSDARTVVDAIIQEYVTQRISPTSPTNCLYQRKANGDPVTPDDAEAKFHVWRVQNSHFLDCPGTASGICAN